MLSPLKLHQEEGGLAQIAETRPPSDLIEDYLDHVCAPLVGVIPFDERSRFREEAGFHIDRLQHSYQAEGLSPEDAVLKAIQTYGEPARVSDRCLESYQENRVQSPLFKRIGSGNFIAFCIFGIAQILYTALLQLHVFLPSGEAYRLPMSPAEARMLLPEPFPIPQSWGDFAFLYGFPLLAPLVAGFLVGLAVPFGASKSVFQAMMPIVIYSFVVGSFMIPITTGLLFALFQAVYWIPIGCLAAAIGTTYAQRRAVRNAKMAIFRSVRG